MNSNWNYSPETVKLGSDLWTLTFDIWPWRFACALLWPLLITPENLMMIQWWEHSEKGVTDVQTDRRKIPFAELLGRTHKKKDSLGADSTFVSFMRAQRAMYSNRKEKNTISFATTFHYTVNHHFMIKLLISIITGFGHFGEHYSGPTAMVVILNK